MSKPSTSFKKPPRPGGECAELARAEPPCLFAFIFIAIERYTFSFLVLYSSFAKTRRDVLCCRNLAIGIGIQNFPEGLAVSLPLRSAGISTLKSFWYGQLSGMVEPLAGVLGAAGVTLAEPMLPYALAFAAGAMIYVVIDDIIPEAHQRFVRFLTVACDFVSPKRISIST